MYSWFTVDYHPVASCTMRSAVHRVSFQNREMGAKRLDSLEGSGRKWEEEKEWGRRMRSIEERKGGR